jgi:hypothetical protein
MNMENNKPENPMAFPTTYRKLVSDEESIKNGKHEYKMIDAYKDGMTLRDYFAAKAMQALLTNSYQMEELEGLVKKEMEKGNGNYKDLGPKILSNKSYELADAMLKERLK